MTDWRTDALPEATEALLEWMDANGDIVTLGCSPETGLWQAVWVVNDPNKPHEAGRFIGEGSRPWESLIEAITTRREQSR